MGDNIDDANKSAEIFLTAALLNRHHSGPSTPSATGACLFCGAKTTVGRRWCDAECRDGWEAEHKKGD